MRTKVTITIFVLVVGFVFALLFARESNKQNVSFTPEPPISAPFPKRSFSKTVPGQSTKEDVVKINGSPDSREIRNNKEYFYYKTGGSSFKDSVVFERGVENYAVQNIFDSSEISLAALTTNGDYKKYGDKDTGFFWYVFLDKGIAAQNDGRDVLKIIYFIPQDETSFLTTVGAETGIIKDNPTREVLRP